MLSSYFFKTKFKFHEKFNAKGIQKIAFEMILQMGIVKVR